MSEGFISEEYEKNMNIYEPVIYSLKSLKGSLCLLDKIVTLRMNRRLPLKDFNGHSGSNGSAFCIYKVTCAGLSCAPC